MTPLPLLTWRYVFATIVGWLFVTASLNGRRSLRALTPRTLAILVFLGILYVGNAGGYTAALQTTPASLVAIIVYLYPAMVAVISLRYARRLEGRRPWVALGFSTAGVALAVGGIPDDADIPVSGLLLADTCAVGYAVWIVLAARMRGDRPGRDVGADETITATGPDDTSASDRGPDALASSAIMSTTTALTAAVLALLVGGDLSPAAVPGSAWLALIGFGTFSGIAVVAFLAGTRRIGAARAALVSTFEPVYTIVLATLLLGETLDPIQVVGGALVVCGVLLAESGRPGRPAPATTDETRGPAPGTLDRATV
jgi:drug/metabolite transporter (DMT)-like permease